MRPSRRRGGVLPFAALAALLVSAGAASAQDPEPFIDPEVMPAQFAQPAGPIPSAAAAAVGAVADPPAPAVRVQVRVPSHAAPGKDLTYRILVTNPSPADAYKVVVRNPLPAGAVPQPVKAEPRPDKADPKELVWTIGRLPAGEKREIEFVLRPTAEAKEVRNQAFVSFEYGQAVVTQIDKPKLQVRKSAPKDAVSGEPFAVRVEVANTGRVSTTGVKLVEDVGKAEFAAGSGGEKGSGPGQRVWDLGTLRPGERKAVDYRITSKDGGDLLTQSAVRSAETPEAERAEETTKVLTPSLTLDLNGPATVPAGEPGTFEIVARNTGTLPLTNVRVTGAVPADCTVTKMTNGGQVYREQVLWVVPKLDPGDARSFRVGLKGAASGPRTVRAAARDDRGLEKAREVSTAFQGTAVLHMRAVPDPVTLSVGRNGLLTVQVTNQGTEAAKNVRLRVELPSQQVRFVQGTPRQYQAAIDEVTFDAVTVPPGRTETFTITYKADRAEQAWFRLKLFADALGERPLTKEQAVEISGRE